MKTKLVHPFTQTFISFSISKKRAAQAVGMSGSIITANDYSQRVFWEVKKYHLHRNVQNVENNVDFMPGH